MDKLNDSKDNRVLNTKPDNQLFDSRAAQQTAGPTSLRAVTHAEVYMTLDNLLSGYLSPSPGEAAAKEDHFILRNQSAQVFHPDQQFPTPGSNLGPVGCERDRAQDVQVPGGKPLAGKQGLSRLPK